MAAEEIRFVDGEAYERAMGAWSRMAGEDFLDWLAPAPGLRWLDVGCGNGAFTEVLMRRCGPAEAIGIDPSEAQIAYARRRPGAAGAEFLEGDALALPFAAGRFDAAVMALAIFFVPDPAKGLAEMVRVVRPGGPVAAYVWDFGRGGFPFAPVHAEMRALGLTPLLPPQVGVSRAEALRALWDGAGLEAVAMLEIPVRRRFADFEAFWSSISSAASLRVVLDRLAPAQLAELTSRLRARLRPEADGGIVCDALANAVRGRVPG